MGERLLLLFISVYTTEENNQYLVLLLSLMMDLLSGELRLSENELHMFDDSLICLILDLCDPENRPSYVVEAAVCCLVSVQVQVETLVNELLLVHPFRRHVGQMFLFHFNRSSMNFTLFPHFKQ